MRHKLALIAVLGGLATGIGCHHIAGKQDCGYNPANWDMPPITTPYPTAPVYEPAPKPKEPEPMPKTKKGTGIEKPGMGMENGF